MAWMLRIPERSRTSITTLQYSVEAAEMEVIQLPGLVRVDGSGLRYVKEYRQDDGLVQLQFVVQGGVVREVQVMDSNSRYARLGLHTPTVEMVPISSVGDADPRVFITVGVHQHSREHETEEGGGQYADLLHSVGHCECFGYRPVLSDARHHPVMKLTRHVREPLRTAEFLHDFPQSTLAGSEDKFGCSAVSPEATLAFREQALL
ncbi:unnamed protein product [Schistocephalus solidus]|uniref:Neutral alpha-glucosidase AB n=1 Tax=Schistocephalus solidus TaxID=70667 RepID=A0A183TH47_SCHSO|nr:unnamed protein product [Schistocephalus solidus]